MRNVFLILSVIALSACSNEKRVANNDLVNVLKAQTGQNGRECVRISDIDGFNYEDSVLTIDGGLRYYVGTTAFRCHEADASFRLHFTGPAGDFCGSPNSRIVGRHGDCPMGSLFEFKNRQEARAALDEAKAQVKSMQAQKNAENTNAENANTESPPSP